MSFKKFINVGLLTIMMMMTQAVMARAVPHFTLNPTSGSQTVGNNFVVIMGIDSDTEKVVGIDIKASFDSSKLEVVSIEKGIVPDDGYQFSYTTGQAIIHNDTGIFEVTLTPLNQSVLVGPIAKHELLKITFKPKAVGTATFNYTCLPGSVVETNIINQNGVDVVDCNANQSGSYTIGGGTGGSTGASSTPVPTSIVAPTGASNNTTTTSTNSTLPQTGVIENTILLVGFGLLCIISGFYIGLI